MLRPHVTLLLLGVFASGLAGCATNSDATMDKKGKSSSAKWGYSGDLGPAHWADLSPEYHLAKAGRQQSPIDIRGAAQGTLPAIKFNYGPSPVNLVFNGHTVEQKEDKTSSIEVNGKKYILDQFHFHSPSEHTVNSGHSAMEMHLVHGSADGSLAVVAVMINVGAENPAFASVWDNMPTKDRRTRKSSATVDAGRLLPADRRYFQYMGSFTTPPCTEGVLWMVLQSPVELSQAQVDQFRAVIHGNNRPVQPLNGRKIMLSN